MAATDRPPLAALGEATNREAQRPSFSKLPKEFLKVGVAATGDAVVEAAAASPETITTSIAIHAFSSQNAAEACAIALTEIMYERAVFSRDIFREVCKYGLAMHRLGSTLASGSDEKLAAHSAS